MRRDELAASRQRQWDSLRDLLAAYAVRRPVGKVAVVGNAPLEPDEKRAAEIDSSDLVFRMNSLRLDEPDELPCLGSACHVVLLSRNTRMTRWAMQDYRHRLYLIPQTGFTRFRTLRKLPHHWPPDLGAMPLPNQVVTGRLADLLAPAREPASVLPTSGLLCAFLAHEMFPDADMMATGFSFLDQVQQTEWQHHAGGSTLVNEKHKLDREGALLGSWIADGSVRFYS